MKIGIVGCGIAGAYISWQLSNKHDVTVFEARGYIGKEVCSGLISERLWDFIPKNTKLITNRIDTIKIHFPKKTIDLMLDPKMIVLDHDKLDRYVVSLGKAKILLNSPVDRVIDGDRPVIISKGKKYEFDYVIGADGPNSIVRYQLHAKDPNFRLGIYVYENAKNKSSIVETWPIKTGFAWKIPRGNRTEIGVLADPRLAMKEFKKIYKGKAKPLSSLVPEGLVQVKSKRIVLAGDASGLAKPHSIEGDESVLVTENGLIKTYRIEDLVKQNSGNSKNNILAFSPNINLKNVDFYPVKMFMEHANKEKRYEIISEKGYRIKATGSHSIMTIDNYKISSKPVSQLTKNDYLLLATKIPNKNELKEINIIETVIKEIPELIKK